jgi:iron complex outermembrane receptor protein
MTKLLASTLWASASMIALGTGAPSAAQTGGDPSDIIVTARRVEERLQDVPISITVFNQGQLDNRNINSGNDLATYTPSLSANSRFGTDNASFAIRGFSQESRTTASVGIYFADVVAPRGGTASIGSGDGAGPGSFFDLQNVQILKGPQGTLFGRNTTGGAVLLVPRRPSENFEGYVEGSIGNYDLRRLQGVINTPLGDTARLRIGFDRQLRDGYMKNISGIGPDDFADLDYWALRASLVVDLTPNLENYTILSYLHSSTNGQLPQVAACNNAIFPQGQPICDQIGRQQGKSKFAVQSAVADPLSLVRQWQIINTTTWQATDQLTIKNIASYSQFYNRIRSDFFGVDAIVPPSQTNPRTGVVVAGGALTGAHGSFNTSFAPPGGSLADQENVTEELQFQGRGFGGNLNWQAGGYLELSNPLGDNSIYAATRLICADRFAFQCANFPGTTGSLTIQRFRASFHNYALYGQASYSLTDYLKLTGGFRYTWDVSRARALNAQFLFPAGSAPVGRCANPTLRPAGNPPINNLNQCLDKPVQKSDAPTWLLGLDFTPMDDLLIYAKYARGYRQGSVNPLAAGGFTTYEPEKVEAYEIGVKASWHGAVPGNLNVAGFYNDLSNQQIALGLTSSPARGSAPPNNAIVNIGQSRLKGVEVETSLGPVAGFRIDASYAYIDAKLKTTVTPTFPADSPYDGFIPINPGQPAPYTPKHKLSLTGTYTLPLPESVGDVSVSATYSYIDKQVIFSTAYGTLPSYELLNFNLNWRKVADTPIDLSLFATNVTNKRYAVAVNDMYASGGFVSYLYGQPRMYGLRLRYAFGS